MGPGPFQLSQRRGQQGRGPLIDEAPFSSPALATSQRALGGSGAETTGLWGRFYGGLDPRLRGDDGVGGHGPWAAPVAVASGGMTTEVWVPASAGTTENRVRLHAIALRLNSRSSMAVGCAVDNRINGG